MPRRVGIVGYGHLGQYLTEFVQSHDDLQLAFVWNRSASNMSGKVKEEFILQKLDNFQERKADLIVEVAHPSITKAFGKVFLQHADYLVGSPTALADAEVEAAVRSAAGHHGLYIPSGALWGGDDIQKMDQRGTLKSLKVTMTKHPKSFKLNGELKSINEKVTTLRTVLYDGPVRGLCPLAPNNVNTMAAACMAANTLSFDGVQGSIVADPQLQDWHIVEVAVCGHPDPVSGHAFQVTVVRRNPTPMGHVTGSATYGSFAASLLRAHGKGPGVHLC